jgi:molybdenum cofactor cytidylyltransferase
MKVSGIILAAGLGKRMGGNKMSAMFRGKPMVEHVIASAKGANLHEIIIVTGFEKVTLLPEGERDKIEAYSFPNPSPLRGEGKGEGYLKFIHNPHFAQGLSTSLKAGINAANGDGALIMLGDMPLITSDDINKIVAFFTSKNDIIVPVHKTEQGNPVLWGRGHFPKLNRLEGDKGAKGLLKPMHASIKEIELSEAILRDFDTQNMLAQSNTIVA